MELKRLITHFTYKIEPKPEGGFVAHASDPSVPPLEAPTREELQQKIQANIASTLAAEFPGLKLPARTNEVKFNFHIEHRPGSGFILNSTDGKELPVVGGTHAEIQSHFAEKLLNALGQRLTPEDSKALATPPAVGDVKVMVNRNVTLSPGRSDNADFLNAANSPITPEPNQLWRFVKFLLAAMIFAIVIYFIRYR
jgi:hypothetical protein